jgi:rhamnosyltransferase
MRKKIAIGFVVYNPNSNLIHRLKETLSLGFAAYIYDNSPDKSIIRDFTKNKGKIKYTTSGKNLGLGVGISTVCAQAYYDDYPALVFFDQDTSFNIETLLAIEDYYIDNQHLISNYSSIVFNSKNIEQKNNDFFNCFKDVSLAINSGSLFFLENLKKMNYHNEKYFVDTVDYEFCLNSQLHNLKIGEYSCTPGFDHKIEQGDKKYKIFGKAYSMRAYSLNRIADTVNSSIRLILRSVFHGKIQFAVRIARLLLSYIVIQIFVRCQWVFRRSMKMFVRYKDI